MGNIYGYIRIRNYDSSQVKLLEQLRRKVKVRDRRFEDTTGEQLRELMNLLVPGDHLYIDYLTSLGANGIEICQNWKKITNDLKVYVSILSAPELSCDKLATYANARLIELVLEDLSRGLSLYRRNMQLMGIDRARRAGKQLGRPKREMPSDFDRIYEEFKGGKLSLDEAAKEGGVSKSTFYNWLKQYGKQ